MHESDYLELPEQTKVFVDRLIDLGFDRERVFGLFVLVGLYAGTPNTEEKIEELFAKLNLSLPIDRTRNIDETIGHLYNGFDRELNEFCYRSGLTFDFRDIKVPNVNKILQIVKLQDEELLSNKVNSIERMIDANRLYDSFILALGKNVLSEKVSLLEAYQCGIFQIQLHGISDQKGTMQIAEYIYICLPFFLYACIRTLEIGKIDYFLNLFPIQVPLFSLTGAHGLDYAEQMWAFQSYLFYRDQEPLEGIDEMTFKQWHKWVVKNAELFISEHSSRLFPFSHSKVDLPNLPTWGGPVKSFEICDHYIKESWGYSQANLESEFQALEYKALVVHVVYASLTSSLETKH